MAAMKDDTFYDKCPQDGCMTVERSHKMGGNSPKGESYLNWAMYNADPRKGGCGATWTRDTKQGVKRGHERGYDPKWKAESAERERAISMPSDAYRDNYSKAFGHD